MTASRVDRPTSGLRQAHITGWGRYAPSQVLTNADLEKMVETSDQWITERTGIKERHIVSEGEKFSDLCTKAADLALKRSHVKPEELDMILVGTISGDMPVPVSATASSTYSPGVTSSYCSA